ncbi:MAG: nucleotidyltransferase domain-containing protein [Cyanobacteria bacterium J06623_4]
MTFPTSLLDARLAREKQQNELDRIRLLEEAKVWLAQNAARYGVKTGYIFGSVTTPARFTARSDVDLAAETFKDRTRTAATKSTNCSNALPHHS